MSRALLTITCRDGNDGPWSTFAFQVGTPFQAVRLLPSSSGNAVWVVLSQGCVAGYPSNCGDLRGPLFSINKSSTWSDLGIFELGLQQESLLGYAGNAQFGFDTVNLSWSGDGLPTLTHQIVGAFITKDFYLGVMGLNPHSVNLTDCSHSHPSLLTALKSESKIPSASWAYTAGSYNQVPKVSGSLTLGGYNTSRSVSANTSFSFGQFSRDIPVKIQSILTDAAPVSLLSSPIYAFIDSLVPHIWLPMDTCRAFEQNLRSSLE